jgi:hypothetical protein
VGFFYVGNLKVGFEELEVSSAFDDLTNYWYHKTILGVFLSLLHTRFKKNEIQERAISIINQDFCMGSAITDNRRSIFFSIRWTYSFLGSL